MKDHQFEIDRAVTWLVANKPFFACLVLDVPVEVDANLPIPTAATDGQWIKFHPDLIEALEPEELRFILAHEVMHKVFGDMFHRGHRDRRLWNIACDHLINTIISDERIGRMPTGDYKGYCDPDLVKRGGETQQGIYELLEKEEETKGGGSAGDQWDDCADASGSPAERSEKEAAARAKVAQAAAVARAAGKVSEGLKRFVDFAMRPMIRWEDQLRQFVSSKAKVDVTWARPNRRFIGEDMYLPSKSGETIGSIVVAIDQSGSVGDGEQKQFGAEIRSIHTDVGPLRLVNIYFDSSVVRVDEFEREDTVTFGRYAGGGTAFSPIFRKVEELDIHPDCLVVLTDLECHDFGPAPAYPVMWITTAATSAPFGQVVSMKPTPGRG